MFKLRFGAIVLAALMLAACGSDDPETPETEEGVTAEQPESITIPVIYSATGPAGGFGDIAKAGFDLAVEELNADGGIGGQTTVELEYIDDASDPNQAVRLTQDAVEADAPVVIGPILSATATPALPRCQQAETPCVATIAGNAPAVEAAAPWAFTFVQSAEIASIGTELFLEQHPEVKSFGQVIDEENPSMVLQAESFAAAVDEAGVKLLDAQAISSTTVDFSAQVTNLKNQNPDAIFIAALNSSSPALVQTIRQQGIEAPIFASTAAISGGFIEGTGKDAEGVTGYAEFWNADPEVADWVAAVTELGGIGDTVDSAAYDTIFMLAEVLGSIDLNEDRDLAEKRLEIQEAIHEIEYQGVQTTYDWGDGGIPEKPTFLLEVEDGALAKIAER